MLSPTIGGKRIEDKIEENYHSRRAYIYAVAVDDSARGQGIGAELTRACMRNAWEYSADICCTLPAEASLYDWYESRCGLAAASFCTYETGEAGAEISGIKRPRAQGPSSCRLLLRLSALSGEDIHFLLRRIF